MAAEQIIDMTGFKEFLQGFGTVGRERISEVNGSGFF